MAVTTPAAASTDAAEPPHGWRAVRALCGGTLAQAWEHRILGLSAEAGFWQLLSLPPLLLTVLGVVGFFADSLGPHTIDRIQRAVLHGAGKVLATGTVNSLVRPALHQVLTHGRADVVSVGFVLALWSGSSATATYVNTITIAYRLRDRRSALRSRLLALWLYLGFVVVGIVLLPALVLGPSALVAVMPDRWRVAVHTVVAIAYWPTIVGLSVVLLATLYHFAVPCRTRWRRALPGAAVAMGLWIAGSGGLRLYVRFLFRAHSTYGPLAAPVVVLLFLYVTALAVLLGAELNAEVDRLWPDRRA